jgi:hypothetical protein
MMEICRTSGVGTHRRQQLLLAVGIRFLDMPRAGKGADMSMKQDVYLGPAEPGVPLGGCSGGRRSDGVRRKCGGSVGRGRARWR